MWFKNLKIYRLSSPWTLVGEQLEETLARHAYQASGSAGANNLEMQSLGWVPPRENGGLAHVVGGQILLTLRAEKKLLPGTVVNQVAKARAQEIEEQQGYKPGRKQMKEIKERVTDELLPRAFSVYRDTRVWIDPQNHWLVIDAAASAKADEVIGLLAKCIDPFPLENLYVVARLGHDRLAGRGRGAVQLHHRPGHRAALVRRKRRGDPIRQALHRRRRRAPPHPVRQAVHAPGHDLGRPHLLRADREPGRQARRAAGRAQGRQRSHRRERRRSSIPT